MHLFIAGVVVHYHCEERGARSTALSQSSHNDTKMADINTNQDLMKNIWMHAVQNKVIKLLLTSPPSDVLHVEAALCSGR